MTDQRDPPFNPELADDRLAAWVDGELSAKDLDRFEAELRVNKRLREQAESYRAFVSSMQGALQQPVGTVDVADRVIAALQRPVAMAPRRSMVLPWLLSAAVAAGLLTAVWIMQGPDAPCPPEGRDSATAPESSKVAGTDNEKKALGEGLLADNSRVEMDRRKAEAGDPGQPFQQAVGNPPPEASAAKPAQEKRPADEKSRELGDAPLPAFKEQSQRSDQKEEAKNKSSDDSYLGSGRREGGQELDKAKKAEVAAPAEGRPTGQPAPVTKTAEPAPPGQPKPGAAAYGESQDKDRVAKLQRDLESQSRPLGGLDAIALPTVPVVVLTRRGTIEELRRNLQPRESNEQERARQQARSRTEANQVEDQLGQQFPSLALAKTESLQSRVSRMQQDWADNGVTLQLYALGIPNVQPSDFRGVEQGRESTGNRMPEGQQQDSKRDETLQRLLPAGTNANALYVEGEPARVQDFLKQVGTWATNNDVEVATDELPAAEVESLKLAQLQASAANLSAQTGGGGGSKAAGPAGTAGPAGPATPGPGGPTTGGPPRSAPGRLPSGPVPQLAPIKAVLLLFREQIRLPEKR